MSSVGAASPVGIGVGHHGRAQRRMDVDVMRHRAVNVTKNPLDETLGHITRRMHVETHLDDGIGDIRACERQVLHGANDTAIERSIGGRRASGGRCFRLGVDWRGRRLAVHHSGVI
jgi:hypothetical protein